NPGPPVSPTGMIFTSVVNGTPPAAQSITIGNVLSGPLSFTATSTASTYPSWFTVVPTQGSVQPGQTMPVSVLPSIVNLSPGVYRGNITLQFDGNITRKIDLILVVASSGTEILSSGFSARDAVIPCRPTQLLLVFTQLGDGFTQPASWPATLET